MNRWVLSAWIALAACDGGCQGCAPGANDSAADSGNDSDSARIDSADSALVVEDACAAPEVEPNDNPQMATILPLERRGCGTIDPPLEADVFEFELTRPSWIALYVDAESIGSRADMSAIVNAIDAGETAQVSLAPDTLDVRMRWPAVPDTYMLLLTEIGGLGGEEYYYDVLVSEVKEPVSWTANEDDVTGNDSAAQAEAVADGDRVFGSIENNFDIDWYAIDIPAGKQTVRVGLDAWAYGSAGLFRMVQFDSDLNDEARSPALGVPWTDDPYIERTVVGPETWYIKIVELTNRGGRPYWYVLDVSVEGTE